MRVTATPQVSPNPALSFYNLFDSEVLANPYPLYHQLRTEEKSSPTDVITVLLKCSADRVHPGEGERSELIHAEPDRVGDGTADVFMDPPTHTRLRSLASEAFTPRRVQIQQCL